jgi:hypothetical protein
VKYLPLIGLLIFVSCTESETKSTTTRKISINEAVTPDPGVTPSVRVPAEIVNYTTSEISHDPADPLRFFVSHPKRAQIRISHPNMYTTHMGFCESAYAYPAAEKTWRAAKEKFDQLKNEVYPSYERQEDLEIRISETVNESLKDQLEEELRSVEAEIAVIERKIERAQSSREAAGKILDIYYKNLYQQFAYANVEWISDWDQNLKQLKLEYPDFEFEKDAEREMKVKFSVRGLELPAIDMVPSLMGLIDLKEVNRELVVRSLPSDLNRMFSITGFAACPLNKPVSFGLPDKKEIIIDVEFSFGEAQR